MTAQRWLLMAIRESGLDAASFGDAVCGKGNRDRMRCFLQGASAPGLTTLLRAEAVSGVSLDYLDPRIRRGMDLVGAMADRAAELGWAMTDVGRTLGVSPATADQIMKERKLNLHATAETAIKVCDLMEGRAPLLTRQALLQLAAERRLSSCDGDEGEGDGLPPEAKGDGAWHRARRAFSRAVNPEWRRFRLRNAGPGLFVAEGDLLKYRLEALKDRVRITAMFRESGIVLLVREM